MHAEIADFLVDCLQNSVEAKASKVCDQILPSLILFVLYVLSHSVMSDSL